MHEYYNSYMAFFLLYRLKKVGLWQIIPKVNPLKGDSVLYFSF